MSSRAPASRKINNGNVEEYEDAEYM